jgi:hypothetical protein
MDFSIKFVLSTLKWISEYFSDIFVIIDGIDECSDREGFCESLGYLVQVKTFKVLVAGRPEHDIATADVFRGKSIVRIDDVVVNNDISTHVRWYIEKDRKLRRHSGELKMELLTLITSKCDGM